ncbi:MAG: hypothetical protein ACI8YQ_000182 [Polaribacter sp.]|jgi:hypothetical protein
MKNSILLIVSTILLSNTITAQNLIPNSGFESYHVLPTRAGEWCAVKKWNNLNGICEYDTASYGSPDYLHMDGEHPASLPNSGLSKVSPYEGRGIIGQVIWRENTPELREYISIELSEVMEIGMTYELSFYTSNGEDDIRYGGYGSSNLGIHFTTNELVQLGKGPISLDPLLELPEILYSNDWVQNTFTFIAEDNFKYIAFGNFRNDDNTTIQQFEDYTVAGSAYYYIDEVCLIKQGDDCSISTATNDLASNQSDVYLYPNPSVGKLLHITKKGKPLSNATILIYNTSGHLVYSEKVEGSLTSYEANVSQLSAGLYILIVENEEGRFVQKFIRK